MTSPRPTAPELRPVGEKIVSTILGRFLTAIVTVLVLAITVHALVSSSPDGVDSELVVGVAARGDAVSTDHFYEPLGRLLSERMSRPVRFVGGAREWSEACDLYVLPAADFMALRRCETPLRVLFAFDAVRNDRAVLIARAGASVDFDAVTAEDFIFTADDSPNGFWAQLMALRDVGGVLDRLREPDFAGDPARVVYSVVDGTRTLGACRWSDVTALVERGGVRRDDVTVVLGVTALPEVVVAAPPAVADRIAAGLGSLEATLAAPSGGRAERDAVELLRSRGMASLRALSPSQVARLEETFGFLAAWY